MRKIEKSSFGWSDARREFETSDISIRKLAAKLDVDEKTVRLRRDAEGWERDSAPSPQPESLGAAASAVVRSINLEAAATPAAVSDLTKRGRGIILDLMAELEFLNRNHETLKGMVEDYINGNKDTQARTKLLRLLDHDVRSKSANQLATALAKLNDAAPGKKEQAQQAAATAGVGSDWEGDLDFATAKPN